MSITTSFLNCLAVIEGDLRHADGGLGIVAVDVEDGRLHAARDVGGIRRGARFVGQRGESDLVVDDQVNGAAGANSLRAARGSASRPPRPARRKPRRRGSAAESRARARCRPGGPAWGARCLPPPDRRLPDGWDWAPPKPRSRGRCRSVRTPLRAQVIFHVAGALRAGRIDLAFEFGEDLRRQACRPCWPARSGARDAPCR